MKDQNLIPRLEFAFGSYLWEFTISMKKTNQVYQSES